MDPAQYPAEGRTELSGCPPAARPNPSQTQPEQLPPCDPKGLRFQGWQGKRWTHFLADQVAGVEGGDGSKRCNLCFLFFGGGS